MPPLELSCRLHWSHPLPSMSLLHAALSPAGSRSLVTCCHRQPFLYAYLLTLNIHRALLGSEQPPVKWFPAVHCQTWTFISSSSTCPPKPCLFPGWSWTSFLPTQPYPEGLTGTEGWKHPVGFVVSQVHMFWEYQIGMISNFPLSISIFSHKMS